MEQGDEAVPLVEGVPVPKVADSAPQPLLAAIRYGDSVVVQSAKYGEVFVARTDAGGVVSAVAWDEHCAWNGSRLQVRPVGSAQSLATTDLVCFGDALSFVTDDDDDELPICQCESSGILCARPVADGWIIATFRVSIAEAGAEDAASYSRPRVLCSWTDVRLTSSRGHYLRAASMSAANVSAASVRDTGGQATACHQHAESVVIAVHSRFSAVGSATKVVGSPSAHVLCCLPSRDKDREVLCLVAASDAASAAARASAAYYQVDGGPLDEDGWLKSTGACSQVFA